MSQTAYLPARTTLPSLVLQWRQTPLRWLLPGLIAGFTGLLVLSVSLLWRTWSTDALRSIGMFFPPLSIILILRVWRRLGWEARGTWWGILPLFGAVVLGRSGGNAWQAMAFAPGVSIELLPLGLTVFAYASGVVLLLGGTRVWRKSLFPLVLLLLVNPVPTAFARIDIPLQYISARTAHAFALAIGVHPDVNQLRLMFAPDFGMFIAPGCNGIRGAVTLGYLALIVGYLYRFSLLFRSLLVFGAVALGYVFNLVRLCILVLFYRVALTFPSLQPHGEGADYIIGGLLFLCAVALFLVVVRKKKQAPEPPALDASPGPDATAGHGTRGWAASPVFWRGAAVCALVLVSAIPSLFDFTARAGGYTKEGSGELAASLLPAQIGKYRLLRTWHNQDSPDHVIYRWAAYSSGEANEVTMGLWFGPGVHYPIGCHLARGDRPAWRELQTLPTATGGSATFDLDFYDEGSTRILEAATVCDVGGCNASVMLPSRVGLVFAGMGLKDLLLRPASTPLPVVVRIQSHDPTLSAPAAQAAMVRQVHEFVGFLNTDALVNFAKTRN